MESCKAKMGMSEPRKEQCEIKECFWEYAELILGMIALLVGTTMIRRYFPVLRSLKAANNVYLFRRAIN